MDFNEEEIYAHQRKMEQEEDDSDQSSMSEGSSDEEGDEESRRLKFEKLKERTDLNDKQRQMIQKIEHTRQNLDKMQAKRD